MYSECFVIVVIFTTYYYNNYFVLFNSKWNLERCTFTTTRANLIKTHIFATEEIIDVGFDLQTSHSVAMEINLPIKPRRGARPSNFIGEHSGTHYVHYSVK